ncbi:MAG: hypothetical protein IJ282_07995 [Lachnospiraceae bacterium]|nr:hypothetical protein [Lachnospiraceae bacterium]
MNQYAQMISRVKAPEKLIENVLVEQREYEYWQADKKADRQKWGMKFAGGVFRGAVMACVFCVCFVFSMQVMAGSVPQVYEWLYLVSPKTAQFFMPVKKVSENAGIRMEVLSAYIHDNVAEIYISMEDLEGERIDETADLYDSYSIHQPFGATGHCQRVGYDEETGQVLFLITVSQWDDAKIAGSKMTFSVREFISQKTEYEYLPVTLDLNSADRDAKFVGKWINGLSRGFDVSDGEVQREDIKVLPPGKGTPVELMGENGEEIVIEGVEISGIAYAEGKLHIQKRTEDIFANDNHGYFWLIDENGEVVDYLYKASYHEKEDGTYTDYEEFVFEVAEEDLGKYTVVAHLWITGTHVEGPWRVTFPLENADN